MFWKLLINTKKSHLDLLILNLNKVSTTRTAVPGDFVDWDIAVVGEGDTCQLCVSFTYHSTVAQSTEFEGNWKD